MTPLTEALIGVFITCAIVAGFGFYWKKREREEWQARQRRARDRYGSAR